MLGEVGTAATFPELVKKFDIDWGYVECPRCYRQQKVEWMRRKDASPPERVTCQTCQGRFPWNEMIHYGKDRDSSPLMPRTPSE
jgi:hypothetical protein